LTPPSGLASDTRALPPSEPERLMAGASIHDLRPGFGEAPMRTILTRVLGVGFAAVLISPAH
jgi:hypothetical protein